VTTIVYYNGELAVERQITFGTSFKRHVKKIKTAGKYQYAFCGETADETRFSKYLSNGEVFTPNADFGAVAISDGKAYYAYDCNLIEVDLVAGKNGVIADGSGAMAALGAYEAFKKAGTDFTAVDLVRAACKVDIYSGGKIDSVKV